MVALGRWFVWLGRDWCTEASTAPVTAVVSRRAAAVPAWLLSTWFVCSCSPVSHECAGLMLARVQSEGPVTASCNEGDGGVGVLRISAGGGWVRHLPVVPCRSSLCSGLAPVRAATVPTALGRASAQ